MPHTLLVSFSLLALVVTARPIAPISDYLQPAEVQNVIKAIFEDRTKQSDIDLLNLTQGEVDVRLISDERQQAVLSQLDGSAVKALVPLEDAESTMPPEVQRLREMLGSSKHLDDIEGAALDEIDVENPAPAVKEPEPCESALTMHSPWASARALTGLSLTSLLAVYTFITLAAVLYAFYLIRGLFPPSHGEEEEKQPLRSRDVESGYADEKGTTMQGKASGMAGVPGSGTPQSSHPPAGVLVNIDKDIMMVDGEVHNATKKNLSLSTLHPAPPEVPAVVKQPWLIPLPPSPTSSPLQRTIQLDEQAPMERGTQPAWALVASDERRPPDARTGDTAPAIDVALAMQLRTGFGATANAEWLMHFLMAIFGWIAVFVGGGGERQARRRLLQW